MILFCENSEGDEVMRRKNVLLEGDFISENKKEG